MCAKVSMFVRGNLEELGVKKCNRLVDRLAGGKTYSNWPQQGVCNNWEPSPHTQKGI